MLHGNGIFDLKFMVNVGIEIPCMKRFGLHNFYRFFFLGFLVCFPCPEVKYIREPCAAVESPIFISPNKDIDELPTIHTWKMLPLAPQALNFQKMEHDKVVVANIVYFHPEPWGDDLIWLFFFQAGLVQPPTRWWFPILETPNLKNNYGTTPKRWRLVFGAMMLTKTYMGVARSPSILSRWCFPDPQLRTIWDMRGAWGFGTGPSARTIACWKRTTASAAVAFGFSSTIYVQGCVFWKVEHEDGWVKNVKTPWNWTVFFCILGRYCYYLIVYPLLSVAII